ncbi:DUF4064 domain-containing protein [Listeria fleischmannii]|uniref:DUF4064 domain-containing protein n=1 Tax=Listeria fleischmannii FSL S10-1203 TaxID=1265822 RepID=W7D1V5_9LIST|nr:DUF4064 domain-containing protein [Listeria fleischmannii]EUJ43192.1 hypothetical protein MCOL2_20663 [Listeria fleischmannii FSL S10-1203]
MASRKPEIILGLIGSIIGLGVGIWIVNYGEELTAYIQTFTYFSGALGDNVTQLGWITFFASAIALIGTLLIGKAPRTWGVIIFLIGLILFFVIGTAWIVSGILLVLTGLMGIFRRPIPKSWNAK